MTIILLWLICLKGDGDGVIANVAVIAVATTCITAGYTFEMYHDIDRNFFPVSYTHIFGLVEHEYDVT